MFGKISMTHFNPTVTGGFLITKHITKRQQHLLFYIAVAEITQGTLLGSLFVKYAIGTRHFLVLILQLMLIPPSINIFS